MIKDIKRINLTALKAIQKYCTDTNCKECPCYDEPNKYTGKGRCILNTVPFAWDLERIDPDDNY